MDVRFWGCPLYPKVRNLGYEVVGEVVGETQIWSLIQLFQEGWIVGMRLTCSKYVLFREVSEILYVFGCMRVYL